MRISLFSPQSQNILPMVPIFEKRGVKVDVNSVHPKCDFIISTTQAQIEHLDAYVRVFPDIPIVSLVLDFYKTVWTAPNPHRYNWELYKHYIDKAVEVWCLSNEVKTRLGEEGIDTNKCNILKIWARFFEYNDPIIDGRYVLKSIRPYVADKNYGWAEKACEELKIPLKSPNHKLSEQEYRKLLAECSFMVCDYHETSTGGLGLLEGLNLGKVSVISDSSYQGAQDYLGNKAVYFDDNNYDDFKNVMKEMWENTPSLDIKKCKAFCNSHPTIEDNVEYMIKRLRLLE